jgi:ABC-type uncharacterized transport system permease subunit
MLFISMTEHSVSHGETQTASTLSYATPVERPTASRHHAAVALVRSGLWLIFFGGCFLIGAFLTTFRESFASKPPPSLTAAGVILLIVLYLVAFLCLAAATALVFVGSRLLCRLATGE